MCLWPSCKIKDIKRNTALDCSIAFLRIRTNAYVVTVVTFVSLNVNTQIDISSPLANISKVKIISVLNDKVLKILCLIP